VERVVGHTVEAGGVERVAGRTEEAGGRRPAQGVRMAPQVLELPAAIVEEVTPGVTEPLGPISRGPETFPNDKSFQPFRRA
jgi:hypothetical protein